MKISVEEFRKMTGKDRKPATKPPAKASVEKNWLNWNLSIWCNSRQMALCPEYRIHLSRQFRSDWAIPDLRVLIEYEGLFSKKSGHTTPTGYTSNCEKYNLAAVEGWIILRYTAIHYKNVLTDLNKIYEAKFR
jgi:hypothetical protein